MAQYVVRGSAQPPPGGAPAPTSRVAPIGLCAGGQERRQLIRHAEHRIMAGVELVPFSVELFGGAALVRLTRIGGAAGPDPGCRPLLPPATVERSQVLVAPDRMLGLAGERPT